MIVFQPTNSEQLESARGEHLATISLDAEPPRVGENVSLGSERKWFVVHVETYYQDLKPLHLAMVSLKDEPGGEWTATWMRSRSPDLSFYVQVSPDHQVLGCGYRMLGDAPTGRLYGATPTNHPTQFQEVPRPWVTDLIDSYRQDDGLFSAIHVCNCLPDTIPELSVA